MDADATLFARQVRDVLEGHLTQESAPLDELARFCALLHQANQTVRLTGLAEPAEMAIKHVLDSLLALPLLDGDGPLLDLGSGGGVPGIPLAIMQPGRPVVLTESRRFRAAGLAGIVEALGLGPRVQVVRERGEAWLADHPVDTIITRAIGSVMQQLELLLPVASSWRRLVMMKGPAGEAELRAARHALGTARVGEPQLHHAELPDGAGRRVLLVFAGAACQQEGA